MLKRLEEEVYVFRVWHRELERDWEAEGSQVLLELEGIEAPVAMRRRCAWLYEAVVRLPSDWLPPLDDAAAVAVGGVLRLPRYVVRLPGDRKLHDGFGYVGWLLAQVEIECLGEMLRSDFGRTMTKKYGKGRGTPWTRLLLEPKSVAE